MIRLVFSLASSVLKARIMLVHAQQNTHTHTHIHIEDLVTLA